MSSSRFPGVAFAAAVAMGCASSPTVAPQTQVRLEPPRGSVTADVAAAPLPNLPIAGPTGISEGGAARLQSLTAVNQDLGTVVRELANRFGMQYQIDPEVRKSNVNTTLRNTTLPQALAAIIPQGVTYEIRDNVLRIGPARVETRIFSLDYVALSRVGTASTVIQRRLGGNSLGAGAGGAIGGAGGFAGGQGGVGSLAGAAGGADVISAVSVADVWEEIRVAIDALVFDAPTGTEGQTQQSSLMGGSAGGGGRPYSRTSPDGRRLIINPIAGTITVTAMSGHLDQIELFIRTFEASIQRQVLIEAKIVEVNLDRSFEFGIDWNVVASNGTGAKFSPGGGRLGSNVEFTLTGGGTQISAVLTALSSQGDVRVLSSPRVSALNNQRAVFDVTTGEIVFNLSREPVVGPNGTVTFTSTVSPTQVNVGIVLDVLPQIGADNTVTMNIRPVVTSVARTATFTSPDGTLFQAPVIDTRESDTMARLRAGETIIIGGLMQNRREKVRSGIPVLRSIPLIGGLFSRTVDIERKAELVIFLTPTIIAGQPPAPR